MVERPLPSFGNFNPSLQYISTSIREITENNYRLEASFYSNEAQRARKSLYKSKWEIVHLGSLIRNAFYLGRFRRIYVDEGKGIPFILPSQITEIYPRASKFVSSEAVADIQNTKVKKGHVLITRSGTIGIVSYVSRTLENKFLSDDIIRVETKNCPGYVYAYLKSKIGRLLVETNNYGAVVSHIEPDHLDCIPVPNPSLTLKRKVHDLVEKSFILRDESNELMDEVQNLLKDSLNLPSIGKLHMRTKQFNKGSSVLNYSVPLGKLDNRLDGSYHVPVTQVIEQHLHKNAWQVTRIGDERISQSIILPSRFKRVYVREGSNNGVVFFGGKQLYELDPSNKKYLSVKHHKDRIESQLTLCKNMTLITCSGTVGKVMIVPSHWQGWTANQHIIRIVSANNNIAGYVYAWLSSDYAYPFIIRYVYGAVVNEIDDRQVSQVLIPLLKDTNVQKQINDKVLHANSKRAEAFNLEQEALYVLDKEIIYAR